MDHRLIIKAAEEADELLAFIHRALQLTGKDRRTVLERMISEQSHLKASRYDPPSHVSTPPTDEQLEQRARDPEAFTPPTHSDPTGETAVTRRRTADKDLKRVLDNLTHVVTVARRTLEVLAGYPDSHHPTPEELQAVKEVEATNRADNCQNCAKAGHDVLAVGTLFAEGVDGVRVCEFCNAHACLDECPTCGKDPGLPTRKECELHHKPPRRMAV